MAQVYIMMKFGWSARRTLEYLANKRPELMMTNDMLESIYRIES